MIDISGRKYFPVYLKQSIDQINRSDKFYLQPSNNISQLVSNNPIIPPKNTSTRIEVERLIISQINLVPIKDDQNQPQISKINPITNNKEHTKVPSHKLTRCSPEAYKNVRAKTVRIGKIYWPPPLDSEETGNSNQQRKILVQRLTQEEIHGNEQLSTSQHHTFIKQQNPLFDRR